ncbi:AAA family ATPase [Demequina litorisediminis]|uniref:AAA family ATPase n=1 Tax=Demequina litorisediminis TaxID=1849022 RepID=UPI0024E0C277|nr:AAA family ATPase [Demequina litorisediminis]
MHAQLRHDISRDDFNTFVDEGHALLDVVRDDLAEWTEKLDAAERAQVEAEATRQRVRAQAAALVSAVEDEGPLQALTLDDLLNRIEPGWWVEGLLQQSSVAILAGEPGLGKSFTALSMAASIATGSDWFGQSVKQGSVLYVVGEGAESFGKRVAAWQDTNGEIPRDRMVFMDRGVNLSREASVARVVEYVTEHSIDLVILDTFSQLTSIDNENDASQVNKATKAAIQIRQARPGATVLLVHHVNKASGGVRGSSALRGNVDTVIVAKGDEKGFRLTTERSADGKQKDGKPVDLRGFHLVDAGASAVVARGTTQTPDEQHIREVLADGEWHPMADFAENADPARRRYSRILDSMPNIETQGTRPKQYRLNAA